MRDIRQDLSDRLDEIEVERGQLQRRFDMLAERSATIRTVLETEERRYDQQSLPGMDRPSPNGSNPRLKKPSAKFIWEALSDHRPRSLGELKQLAGEHGLQMQDGKNLGGRCTLLWWGCSAMGLCSGYLTADGSYRTEQFKPVMPLKALKVELAQPHKAVEKDGGGGLMPWAATPVAASMEARQ